MSVSTHILDAAAGYPAAGVRVTLTARAGAGAAEAGTSSGEPWAELEAGLTDVDGRHRFAADTPAGTYRLTFATGDYFAARGVAAFYPEVTVTFSVTSGHFHVPLLLSPFAYSTYRGS